MKKFEYKHKRFSVEAKRKGTDEKWSEWTLVDDYDNAVKHYKRAKELGYDARIVDRGERIQQECPNCTHFVGCECFDGKTCDEYEKKKR